MSKKATHFAAWIFAVGALAGCAGNATNGASPNPAVAPTRERTRLHDNSIPPNVLVAFDNQSATLEYWPIQQGGGQDPTAITSSLGISDVDGMAADRRFLAIASSSPSRMVTYNLVTHVEMVYPDAAGPPTDIVMTKGDTIYALNAGTITAYPLDRSAPRTITCSYITQGVAIAADDGGDVFVNGYGPSFTGVVEFPTNTWTCIPLNLNAEQGVIGGLGVDPATNNLIVIDNPGSCSTSGDGRMTIYTPPYSQKNATIVNLDAAYCAGTLRLDAISKNMFLMDSNGSFSQVDELSYPGAQSEGVYNGGVPGGFITLPNTLPN